MYQKNHLKVKIIRLIPGMKRRLLINLEYKNKLELISWHTQ
jgi:hypothetical protein